MPRWSGDWPQMRGSSLRRWTRVASTRAGLARGVVKGVLEGLNMKVVLHDESEAYFMGQALAGLAGGKSFETRLFFGDENQRLGDFNLNPRYHQSPMGQR